jgi:hypothetical protein
MDFASKRQMQGSTVLLVARGKQKLGIFLTQNKKVTLLYHGIYQSH